MDRPATAFKKFRLGQIRPEGWLKEQLRLEADALMGNLDRIKPSIKYSPYETGEGQDAAALPIWLESFIHLAWVLDDRDLKTRAASHLKAIENNCEVSGWIKNGDIWALLCLIRCLDAYLSACDDLHTEGSLYIALKALDGYVDTHELTGKAAYRWFEALPAIKRIYVLKEEDWLLTLAKKLEYNGKDWLKFFDGEWLFDSGAVPVSEWSSAVNNAYAVKCGAVMYNLTGDRALIDKSLEMISKIDRRNGTVTGMFTGDPTLAGKATDRGFSAEAAAEYINSLIYLEEASCSPELCDKTERIIFNVIPSLFSTDMWAYQRVSMINQTSCTCGDGKAYSDPAENAAAFGMADNDGDTAEVLAQAYPKFVSGIYFKTDEGIALTSYVPSVLVTEIDNCAVTVECDSEYPFRDSATLRVTVSAPCSFELRLRMPKWAENVKITTDSGYISPAKGDYCVLDGTWTGTTVFSISFKSEFKLKKIDKSAYAVTKGPIVYALALNQERKYITDSMLPYANYELLPVSEWEYALVCDDKLPFSKQITYEEKAAPSPMLSKSAAPIEVFAYGKKIEWGSKAGNAAPAPAPVCVSDKRELLRFVPYGSTNLRIAEMPMISG